MKLVRKLVKWFLVSLLIVFLFILPFVDKGVVLPEAAKGIALGEAIGENLRNFAIYWLEFLKGLVQGLKGPGN